MKPSPKFLVPVDFSECSMAALESAFDLAQSFRGTLDLIHVWSAPVFASPDLLFGPVNRQQTLAQITEEHALADSNKFVEEARKRGIVIGSSSVVEGDAARTICDVASKNDYDMIVMGTQGRTGLEHLLLGSVAEKVTRHSTVPVMTVRAKTRKAA